MRYSSKSDLDGPITFYNRESGRIETERVYGEGFLRWAYGTGFGRLSVAVAVQRLWFSRWYGWRMNRPGSRAKIDGFIRDFGVDVGEFADSVESFSSFNAFFYRQLRPAARPVEAGSSRAVFPADGRHLVVPDLSESGNFYIKGQSFDLFRFLGDRSLAETFSGGALLISRLCPVDYHRFHFPVGGFAGHWKLLPGSLRSVSPLALRRRLSILWENRRVRTLVESKEFGKVVITEIGATCVGGIHQTYGSEKQIKKGDEKGYFSFGGSCVATIFERGRIRFSEDLLEHSSECREVYAKMGQSCGDLVT